jgi:hypothetical protein
MRSELMVRSNGAGVSGWRVLGATGSADRIATITLALLPPRNGDSPVAIS